MIHGFLISGHRYRFAVSARQGTLPTNTRRVEVFVKPPNDFRG
jgi:hypothetical protein